MNSKKLTLLNAALAGVLAAGSVGMVTTAFAAGVKCEGANSCKGTGECGGKGHSCSGSNACKGKGWTTMDSEKACTDKGGTVVKEAAPSTTEKKG